MSRRASVGEVFRGAGEPEGEQGFVDGAEVADLQTGVVESGGFRPVVLEGDGAQNGRHVDVGDLGALQQVAAWKAGGGEEAAVVGGHSGSDITRAHHTYERSETVPALGGPAAERATARPRVISQLAGAVGAVGGRADGQVAAGFGVEQEHKPKDERQRGFLDLLEVLAVAEVRAF